MHPAAPCQASPAASEARGGLPSCSYHQAARQLHRRSLGTLQAQQVTRRRQQQDQPLPQRRRHSAASAAAADLAAAPAAAVPADDVARYDALLRWCIEQHQLPPLAVEPAVVEGDLPGVQRAGFVTVREVAAGEALLQLPGDLAVTSVDVGKDAALAPLAQGRSELVGLALWLMLERSKVGGGGAASGKSGDGSAGCGGAAVVCTVPGRGG